MGDKAKVVFLSLTVLLAALIVLNASLVMAAWTYPKEPLKTPPTTIVYSPHSAVYGTSEVLLNFSVVPLASWARDDGYDAFLKEVSYQFDSNDPEVLFSVQGWWNESTVGIQNFSAIFAGVSNGPHKLFLNITVASPYDIFSPGDPHGHFASGDVWQANQLVEFTVDSTVLTPAPSNSVTPSPSPTVSVTAPPSTTAPLLPSPTLIASPSPSVPEFTPAAVLVLVSVTGLVAVAFRERRRLRSKSRKLGNVYES